MEQWSTIFLYFYYNIFIDGQTNLIGIIEKFDISQK